MLIKNGIITSDKIKIVQNLIPISHTASRPQYQMSAEYITIHNTADSGVDVDRMSKHVTTQTGYKSWHFTVGSKEIHQHLPITESGWHSGDGQNGTGNRKSIGIEICEVGGAEELAIKFVAELLKALNMSIDKVVPHKHWSGKNCPRLILPHWNVFIEDIKKEMNEVMLTVDEAKKLLKENANIDDNSIQYLEYYRYGEDLIKKLAVPMVNNIVVEESIIEPPKLIKPKVEFSKTVNNTFMLYSDVENLKVKEVNKSNGILLEENYVNSTFFWSTTDGKKYSTSILYADGITYQSNANHLPYPQDTFIINKDNSVEMKRIKSLGELNLSKVKIAIAGVGLIDKTNSSFVYDPAGCGFKGVYADVLRKTNKTMIVYNKSEDKLYLVCRPNIYHQSSLYYDLIDLAGDIGDIACAFDGGGSTTMGANGKIVVNGDGRVIHSILYF